MATFLDYIKKGDASKATSMIESVLNQKTLQFIKEQRADVSKAVYGDNDDTEEEELTEGKRTDPYDGPFPRKRHSHKCKSCVARGQYNSVACYKSHCTRPQLTDTCSWCRTDPSYSHEGSDQKDYK
jgi:hypothetical protein